MQKVIQILCFGMLVYSFSAHSMQIGMFSESENEQEVKIVTDDGENFSIAFQVAQTSKTIKRLIKEQHISDEIIPLPGISKAQFELCSSLMDRYYQKSTQKNSENKSFYQPQNSVVDLQSESESLHGDQLIDLAYATNYLELPFIHPILELLAKKRLDGNQWAHLQSIATIIDDFWKYHPAKDFAREIVQSQNPYKTKISRKSMYETRDGKEVYFRCSWPKSIYIRENDPNGGSRNKRIENYDCQEVMESIDGNHIITSMAGEVSFWGKNNYQLMDTFSAKSYKESKDGKWHIIVSDNKITLQDKNSDDHHDLSHLYVQDVFEGNKGRKIVSWSKHQPECPHWPAKIKIWDKDFPSSDAVIIERNKITDVFDSRDGKNLIAWSGPHKYVEMWDYENLYENSKSCHLSSNPKKVIESKNGKYLVVGYSKRLELLDKQDLNKDALVIIPGLNLPDSRDWVDFMLGHDGKLITYSATELDFSNKWCHKVAHDKSENGIVEIYDLQEKPIRLAHGCVRKVIESEDGRWLISSSHKLKKDGVIKIWDTANYELPPLIFPMQFIVNIIASRDGKGVTCICDCEIDNAYQMKKIDLSLLSPTRDQIFLLLALYFMKEGGEKFSLSKDAAGWLKKAYEPLVTGIKKTIVHNVPQFPVLLKKIK